jgi:HD-GYP domain-containing protein (c-di-GMP phosphodiesterase class II)
VRINTFRPGHPVQFDVYIAIGGKHLHYIRSLEPFDENRLLNLKGKGVKKMFIATESEDLYLDYLDKGLSALTDKSQDITKRGSVAQDTLITEAENVERSLENEHTFKKTEVRVGKVVEFLTSDKSALRNVLGASGSSSDIFQHSANVCSLSLALAVKLGEKDSKALFNLAIAALLHDAGLTKLGLDPLKPRDQHTPDEKKLHLKHPETAIGMFQEKPLVTPAILRLIIDHEEIGNGQGFPEKKRLSKLPLSSQVLNLCNEYDQFSLERKIPPLEVLREFFELKRGLFEVAHMTKLEEVITGK